MIKVSPPAAAVVALASLALVTGVGAGSWDIGRDSFTSDDVSAEVLEGRDGILVRGLPRWVVEDAATILRVYPAEADWHDPGFPSVQGEWQDHRDGLSFRPRYPLASGVDYLVVLHPGCDEVPVAYSATPLGSDTRTGATVVALYPSSNVLPANQLKLYLHFSRPMRRWDPYDHIQLIDDDTGDEIPAAFHAMRDGLWDASGTRLTIVFDPGRVKRGLANNLALGAPLSAGKRYRLAIDSTWLDASGRPLAGGFIKRFGVVEADRVRPDPDHWGITTPDMATTSPVLLHFGETMDHALLMDFIDVVRADGTLVSGMPTTEAAEREWRFHPATPWQPGSYLIRVDRRIEDLAGNNVERLFDVDLTQPGEAHEHDNDVDGRWITLPFTVYDTTPLSLNGSTP
jgi:hypothetical protein